MVNHCFIYKVSFETINGLLCETVMTVHKENDVKSILDGILRVKYNIISCVLLNYKTK